ncbi:MAG TPA: V-type ATP synthase subunit F [Candidatus Hydrogenedentes bacterium]|nr:V-type ATP synthase subunit F [Candidatus Hydrogenedentota bacterium]HOS03451.1 V-type ATP synthase subunit F [Candidatus Hydrogenedentota bacterium]
MARAIVVGERHLILGFKGVGMEIIPAQDREALHRELMTLARDPDVALVLVTESLAAEAPESIAEFRGASMASLTVIPTHEGSRHVSFEMMRRLVEKSIGVDVLGKD